MVSKVAVVEFDGRIQASFEQALKLIGGIDDLDAAKRSVVIKVGVFDPRADNHTKPNVVRAIINSFKKAPQIYLAESDNYRGPGLERLQLWKELFTKRVVPFNLSDDTNVKNVKIADEEMNLSHILFKPNVLVSTHIMRDAEIGSIIKNLFGLIPDRKKMKYHKKLETVLLDIYEAVGGIDLAVLDATYLYHGTKTLLKKGQDGFKHKMEMNTLLIGRDAVAVETVGAKLAGLEPEKMPIIQKAVDRRLGEGNLEKIEIVGSSFEEVQERFVSAIHPLRGKKKRKE